MACGTLTNFTIDSCQGNIGGVKKVWIGEMTSATSITISGTSAGDEAVSAITGVTFKEFPLKKNSAQATSEFQIGDGGSCFVQTTIEMNFNRQDGAKRLAINSLMDNELVVIYEDCNGMRWLLGKDNPVTLSAGGGETGTNKTDLNKYTASLIDESLKLPYPLIESLQIPVA